MEENANTEKNTAGQHEKHEKERIIFVPDKPLDPERGRGQQQDQSSGRQVKDCFRTEGKNDLPNEVERLFLYLPGLHEFRRRFQIVGFRQFIRKHAEEICPFHGPFRMTKVTGPDCRIKRSRECRQADKKRDAE
ncbi:MAG: hypothetical protein IJH79_00740, partial [Lentisphaeria bacterium]|nr:hypothetical protein [Lentisphaeria bacterium]